MTNIKPMRPQPQTQFTQTGSNKALTVKDQPAISFSGQTIFIRATNLAQQKAEAFLTQPQLQLDGEPVTGLDLLKLLKEMIAADGKRDWLDLSCVAILTGIGGGLPLISKGIRQKVSQCLQKGTRKVLFFDKLQGFQTVQGHPCNPKPIIDDLENHQFIDRNGGRYLLTKKALQALKEAEAKAAANAMPPKLSRIQH